MKVLILDNYDSFTFNLVHIIREMGADYEVHRNDKIALEEVNAFDKILLSPGPGIPDEAGIMKDIIRKYADSKSILGICLGHQGMAEVFGASLFNIPNVLHGVTSTVQVLDEHEYLFDGVSKEFQATHYHSWAVLENTVPGELIITAINPEGLIMGLRHKTLDIHGLQFHPESVMTPEGPKMITNWINHNA